MRVVAATLGPEMTKEEQDRLLDARLADFEARTAFVQQYVDACIDHWHRHPELAPRPARTKVYANDDEAYADELGLDARDYINQTMR